MTLPKTVESTGRAVKSPVGSMGGQSGLHQGEKTGGQCRMKVLRLSFQRPLIVGLLLTSCPEILSGTDCTALAGLSVRTHQMIHTSKTEELISSV